MLGTPGTFAHPIVNINASTQIYRIILLNLIYITAHISRHNRRTPLVRDHAIRRSIKAHGNRKILISTRKRYPNLVFLSEFYLNIFK
uniref:Maco-A 23 n=1 Tax=Mamestra configurata nucleopolyhedrovirus TaxID=207830 RepID=A0A7G7Y8Y8_NPVMC|nr:maco-A 23 [Mamestra configurata nucleopolyhedrovirus A]